MQRYTHSTRRRLSRFNRGVDSTPSPLRKAVIAPTLILVEDALRDVEEVVDLTMSGPNGGPRKTRWREGADTGLSRGADGAVKLHGRKCCYALARRLDREVGRIRLPADYRCSGCGALWRLEMRARTAGGGRGW